MGGGLHNPFFGKGSGKNCDDLIIKTQLYSPDPDVLDNINTGDYLGVEVLGPKGPCVATHKGKIAGTILSVEVLKLIMCISQGTKFRALVRRVTGGECAITVTSIKENN
jgi:hypothetical protein